MDPPFSRRESEKSKKLRRKRPWEKKRSQTLNSLSPHLHLASDARTGFGNLELLCFLGGLLRERNVGGALFAVAFDTRRWTKKEREREKLLTAKPARPLRRTISRPSHLANQRSPLTRRKEKGRTTLTSGACSVVCMHSPSSTRGH